MRTRRRERGATLVEAALTILLLITLLFGIVEFGMAYHVYQIATNAAREGARFSVAPDPVTGLLPSTTQVQERVQQYLDIGRIDVPPENIVITQNTTQSVNNVFLTITTVNISTPYEFNALPFGSITISTEARMRNETN